jgi:hypothetical protein
MFRAYIFFSLFFPPVTHTALCIQDVGLVLDYTTVYLHRICVIEFSVVTQDCIMGERIRIMLRIAFLGFK